MAIPSYMTIIEKLFTELDVLLNSYVFHAYHALAGFLKAPLGLAMVLYIVLMGLSITQGWVKLSMGNFVKSSVKLALIYTAAMNWGWFSHMVIHLINQGAGQIGDVLIDATPVPIPHFAGTGINGAMQSVLIEFAKIGAWVWDKGSWHNMGPCLTAILIWGFGYALILVAVFELVLAKIMLAVLFAVAPLFIGFTLFKPTHPFFDRWLGACVGFGLLMIFVSSMLALALSIAQWAIAGTYVAHAANLSLVGFVPVMIVGFMGVGIILKAAQLAQAIGGTITTTSGSLLLAGAIGGAVGNTINTFKMPVSGLRSAKDFLGGAKGQRSDGSAAMHAIRQNLMKSQR
jgi:type IV secretion system protein VirB6